MAKVLYIWSNPKRMDQSFSLRVADSFVKRYRQLNPSDEIIELDLYNAQIPLIDDDVLKCWDLLRGGCSLNELSSEGKRKLKELDQLVEQFIEADKYVFVTPMWNLSIPPVMKAYIDTICIAGKTFKYTENGPVGLLDGKKAVHIQARGGVYSQGPAADFELGDRYMRTILAFLGVTDTESIIVEGMFQTPDQADTILQQAQSKAEEAAQRFSNFPLEQGSTAQNTVHPIH